jgi:probable F420-dependent oxidoreductase
VEIGLHLPSAQPGAEAESILAVAKKAEELGFDAVWMFDHLFTPSALESLYPYSRDGSYALSAADPFFDPLGLFGVLAGATEKVRIGTGVMVAAYRHPIVLGKALATIERFAPGRIVLGLGSGWMREEFEAVGMAYERRGAMFNEYLQALRAMWSGAPVSFGGEFFSWEEAGFQPSPTRHIPLIVGGHSDAALRRAARYGDGWAIVTGRGQGSGLDGAGTRLALLDSFLEAEGKSRDGFELLYQHPMWFSDSANPKMPLTGPPEAMAESLHKLDEMGVTMVDLVTFGPTDLIIENAQRFAEEVRPLL